MADSAAQRLLPEGWQIEAPTTGPSKGSNVSVVLLDQILAQDAEGKPVDAVRGAALVIPAKKQGMEKAVPAGLLVDEFGTAQLMSVAGTGEQGSVLAVSLRSYR